jgi:phospholipid transport system transporter-binding protein
VSEAALVRLDAGCYRVDGKLVFTTVGELLAASTAQFSNELPREIDLSGVTSSDSAGLALLIEWMGLAHRRGSTVQFTGTPAQLNALAKISDLDKVLSLNDAA